MKGKGTVIWRASPFGWMSTRSVNLAVGLIAIPQKEALKTIESYFLRKVQ
jgi:hypothetical protein